MRRVRVSTGHFLANPVKIEKNIPLPTPISRGRPHRYPWKDMDIGDSFLFPKEIKLASCRTMAWDAGQKLRRRFTVMKTDDGTRCWRIIPPEPIEGDEDAYYVDR